MLGREGFEMCFEEMGDVLGCGGLLNYDVDVGVHGVENLWAGWVS